ncbi:MAG: hypothetical protein WA821_17600 [Anaerolineales bacterium]
MFVLLTFILLFLSISAVVALRLTRPGASYTWLVVGGVLLTWLSVLLWQFDLPWRLAPGQWMAAALFNASPQLFADPLAWLYALSLGGLAAAVILTSPARNAQAGTASWPETLVLTGLGLLAILANNPLGLVLAWTAIDLAEFVIAVRERSAPGESLWLAFAVRLGATVFALWASVVGVSSTGQPFSLESAPAQAGIFLLIAAGLRLGALPLSLAYQPDRYAARRGFGTILCMVSAVTGLLVLARIPSTAIDLRWIIPLFALAALAALYGGSKWLLAQDELSGRPYWLIGMSALSLAACLGGNPVGSAAWGIALILFGGISFLYSAKQTWMTRVFAVTGLFMLSLPFTLTASGWQIDLPLPFVFWPLFILAHAMLAAGYARHLLHPAETEFAQLPNWAQATYPMGMGILVATVLLGGLWGWPGAFRLAAWQAGLAALLLSAAILFAFLRLPFLKSRRAPENRPARLAALLKAFSRALSFLYQLLGGLIIYVSGLLEGDGGLLWTLLLLILLISFLRGR